MKKATITIENNGGSKEGQGVDSPSQLTDARIKELGDWRGETLACVRSQRGTEATWTDLGYAAIAHGFDPPLPRCRLRPFPLV